jgi:hypothetical protein
MYIIIDIMEFTSWKYLISLRSKVIPINVLKIPVLVFRHWKILSCHDLGYQMQWGKQPLALVSGNFRWRVRYTLYSPVWRVTVVRRVETQLDYNPLKGMLVIKLLFYISDRCVLLFSVDWQARIISTWYYQIRQHLTWN